MRGSFVTQRRPLNQRVVRSGLSTIKLDKSAAEGKVRFPRLQKKKKRKLEDKQQTYQAMKRVGAVSMIQIGEDEFRMPTRRERRRAGMRSSNKNPLAQVHYGKPLRKPVVLGPELERVEDEGSHTFRLTALGAARRTSAAARERTYTRKAKGRRKAEAEVAASYAAVEHPWGV